jgi:hypothetical protein
VLPTTTPPLDFTMQFTGTGARANAILEGRFVQPPSTTPAEADLPPLVPYDDESDDEDDASFFPTQLPENPPAIPEWHFYLPQDEPAPASIIPEDMDPFSLMFVEELKYKTTPDSINECLSLSEYKGKLSIWDERTSTSPSSNMHLGHLKAYWADHTLAKDTVEEQALETLRSKILRGHLLLLNYALKFGYSYNIWKHIVNTMLEKEPGNPRIHRLLVIHLYEADYTATTVLWTIEPPVFATGSARLVGTATSLNSAR